MNTDFSLRIISPLKKLYHQDVLPDDEFLSFSILKNEKKSFQIAIETSKKFVGSININSLLRCNLFLIEHIKSDFPMYQDSDDYFRLSDDNYYPDLLIPVNDKITFKEGINVFWVEVSGDKHSIGNNNIDIVVSDNNKTISSKSINIEVIDYDLDFGDFLYTNWFHSDCLMSHYRVDAFSDEYWRIVENFLKTANEHGMNCVLTPLFTPPLDTEIGKERPTVQLVDIDVINGKYFFKFDKLTKWIDVARNCGITHFELSHFYTQWGACHAPKIMANVDGTYKRIFGWETKASSKEYSMFLTKLSFELKKYFENNNLKDNVLIHVSDEPNFSKIIPYSRASKLIHKLFKGYKIIDALSDPWFYKLRIVSSPIPSNDHIDKFLGRCENLWTYYCCGQHNNYVSNRFFCYESLRNRIIGYQLYKFNIKGFLQWGYNFYYTQLSKELIDPYLVSDAGGKFPSGDSFVVYPAEDGTAYCSIRLKVFYDALQDMSALNALEKLTDRNTCIDIIEDGVENSLTFSNYPHSEEWLLKTRESINKKIKENLK